MMEITGRITRIREYEEEGRTDWALAFSKICWLGICVLLPASIFRFFFDMFGALIAVGALLVFLLVVRLGGPLNLVMLDELLSRIFPVFRSAVRTGRIRVRTIRVQREDGREVDCILRGDLTGIAPMLMDRVTLSVVSRGGVLNIIAGANLSTDSVCRRRPEYSCVILLVTVLLVVFFVLYLTGCFDRWLYPLVVDWLNAILEEWAGPEAR